MPTRRLSDYRRNLFLNLLRVLLLKLIVSSFPSKKKGKRKKKRKTAGRGKFQPSLLRWGDYSRQRSAGVGIGSLHSFRRRLDFRRVLPAEDGLFVHSCRRMDRPPDPCNPGGNTQCIVIKFFVHMRRSEALVGHQSVRYCLHAPTLNVVLSRAPGLPTLKKRRQDGYNM